MRNETEFIKCSKKRYLTAKASKFQQRCVEIAANSRGIHNRHPEFKETKNRLRELITSLFIDEKLSIEEIKELIKKRKLLLNK